MSNRAVTLLSSILSAFHRNRSADPAKHGRISPRLMVSEPVRFRVGGEATPMHSGMIEDLSATGISVRTHQKLAVGGRMTLHLSLGASLKCEAPARIVHVRPEPSGFNFRYGLRFIGLTDDERRAISEFIAHEKQGREVGVRGFPQEGAAKPA